MGTMVVGDGKCILNCNIKANVSCCVKAMWWAQVKHKASTHEMMLCVWWDMCVIIQFELLLPNQIFTWSSALINRKSVDPWRK